MVVVANGKCLDSSGRWDDLIITISREPFSIRCYGPALGSYDMVLGVQWLESLGPVLWAFGRRTMAFPRGDRTIMWLGTMASSSLILAVVEPDLMQELLASFQSLFTTLTGLPSARRCSHQDSPHGWHACGLYAPLPLRSSTERRVGVAMH